MSATTSVKDERINLRLKHNAKQMLERAASFEGKTISKFILGCALERAEQTIHEHEVMSLSAHDSETFFNALAAPAKFNHKLSEALKNHDKCVISK
jgi:uncharacterized protein (DUF1778 family)